ncbi:hypothetical protein N9L68_09200, partial [bacterium]|nr:hypothetical protein [bacterium]
PVNGVWLCEHARRCMSALTNNLVRGRSAHGKPRLQSFGDKRYKKWNQNSVMFPEKCFCEFIDGGKGRQPARFARPWIGAILLYTLRPSGD